METEIRTVDRKTVKPNDDAIVQAAELLRQGELVGFPTETVYGLGVSALDGNAVKKVYVAKGRPSDNPLIVHVASPRDAEAVAETVPLYYKLADTFMPGPLTVILKKKAVVPDEVTAGMDTVAIRCPSHPVAHALIEAAGIPVAAPSGNRSGLPSPTCASHMIRDMMGLIPMILDGGDCDVGVESTVVKVEENGLVLLRPGAVTREMLEKICPVTVAEAVTKELADGEKPLSPGMKYKHYAPRAEVTLLDCDDDAFLSFVKEKQASERCGVLCYDEEIPYLDGDNLLPIGSRNDESEQLRKIFARLREADDLGVPTVYGHLPKTSGMSLALYNRLIRAAAHRVIRL